ncbi:hypothetical protein BGZ58_010965 [Dissophora ornata]|nr:hypothetical protein BGZ58_010965 [Dissophora ornata]
MAQQKGSFKKWWKNITGTKAVKGLFHIDLVDSIIYAGVPVNYTVNGQTRCQGYIPTIVSKCGWLLKEQATHTRGIFRVSGSAKRVADLQLIFDTPPKYGSQLDWTGYTIHDASNVLRRYLNHLPDPVITLEYYEKFRDVHRNLTDEQEQIAAYQELMSKLPPPHSCLLMYLLDLLALFAHHCEDNLMDSKNLASVFQPGVLSHPNHAMSPGEYMTSAAVLKFLIDHQSSFTMPTPNIDEEDEEMSNFGLRDPPTQSQLPIQQAESLGPASHGGGYVNASDHERIHSSMLDGGVSFEAQDAVHILNSGVRRQLSLNKPIIPHSTLPGSRPQRSKSTSSSTSSHHSNQSGLSNFLTRRRSNRNSKTGSKIFSQSEFPSAEGAVQDQDLSDIPENPKSKEEKAQTLLSSSIRRAATAPSIEVESANLELSSYLSRRKQLRAEGINREPSVFCQTVEVHFQAPVLDSAGQAQARPFTSTAPIGASPHPPMLPRGDRRSQNIGELLSRASSRTPVASPNSQKHIPDLQMHQRENPHGSPSESQQAGAGQRRISKSGQPRQNTHPVEYGPTSPQRTVNPGMPILRAKSNPGDLTSVKSKSQQPGALNPGGNQTIEKFKGLFTGKHRDQDPSVSPKNNDNNDAKKERRRESLTDAQRRYKSQELSHLQGSSAGWKGAPAHGAINEHENKRAYVLPPPPLPQQKSETPPQRPPPPPPEASLMDLLDPRQRIGHYSGYSTPSADSRSASPARVPSSSRQHLPANASFTSTSSVKSMSSSDRHHGRGLQSQGSSSSLEFAIPGHHPGHHPEGGSNPRQRPPRPGHVSQGDPYFLSQYQDHPTQDLQYGQQNLPPHDHSRHHQHHQQHTSDGYEHGSNSSVGNPSFEALPPPQPTSRSRQGSFGSNDTYDMNAAPTPTQRSRERRLPREGSSSSLRGDATPPPRARSNSSKNSSPIHSPALTPLTRAGSNQAGYHSQHQQYHGSSPLAEGYNVSLPPSGRARNRAQSRDEQHLLRRQESGGQPMVPPRHFTERERSRSGTGLALTSSPIYGLPPIPVTQPAGNNSNTNSIQSKQYSLPLG